MAIVFYKVNEEYGCFSNFAPYEFEINGKYWITSEHYFQAQKFVGTIYEEQIRLASTPMKAAILGRDRNKPLRLDWDKVKDDIMREAVLNKFRMHKKIRDILLLTGTAKIIENTTDDYYWGCGRNGTGKNMLGVILMEIREMFKNG